MARSAFLPANGTILGQNGWYNGSVADQLAGDWKYYSPYPQDNQKQILNISVYPNNFAALKFPVHDYSVSYAFPLAQAIFDQNSYRVEVECSFPLSGQYDFLPRILFYLLLVFALLFRRHNWLATAALGTAMIYAASTSVHMFALLTWFGFGTPDDPQGWNRTSSQKYGDVDVFGIYPVLSAAGIMLTPILNWSASFRANDAQPVVSYWGVLVFSALVPAWAYYNYITEWYFDTLPSIAVCPYSAIAQHPECGPNVTLNTVNYKLCQCFDFCGTLNPIAPLRRSANMVAWLERPISVHAATLHPKSYERLFRFNGFVLGFIVIHGIFGLLESQFTQAEIRNIVFRTMYAEPRDFIILLFEGEREEKWKRRLHMENPSDKRSLRWKVQLQIARLVAASFFVFAILFAILCPAVFITSIISNEINTGLLPGSEQSDSVGAWSTLTGAAFVLIAAFIVKYHKAWMKSLRVGLRGLWRVVAFGEKERRARFYVPDKDTERMRDRIRSFFLEVASPFQHFWYSVLRAQCTTRMVLGSFLVWWKDPITQSKRSRKNLAAQTEMTKQNFPRCPCRICEHHREAGDDAEEETAAKRKGSTVGEKLVGGLERRYTQHRKEGGGVEYSPIEIPDYGLPTIPSVSESISIPDDDDEDSQREPSFPPAQPRHTYQRQNSDYMPTPPRQSSSPQPTPQFTITRKPVRSGTLDLTATEDQRLLLPRQGSGEAPAFTEEPFFMSGAMNTTAPTSPPQAARMSPRSSLPRSPQDSGKPAGSKGYRALSGDS